MAASQQRLRLRQPVEMKTSRITIQLPSRPADYAPGSGPPLLRLSLQPPADSTAFIEDRILLPPAGLAADGRPLPKRMKYIIGWHDLPAARLLVSAMDVLDYVSPNTLEEWEYKMELEVDAERARLAAERQAAHAQPQPQLPGAAAAASDTAAPGKMRRSGRPPLHHTNIEAAVVVETEGHGGEQERLRGGAMSLSTPKKRKMDDFVDGYTSDESPSDQLLFDLARSKRRIDDGVPLTKEDGGPSPREVDEGASQGNQGGDDRSAREKRARPVPVVPAVLDKYQSRKITSKDGKRSGLAAKFALPLLSASATTKPKPKLSESSAVPLLEARTQVPARSPTQAATHSSRPIIENKPTSKKKSGTPQPPTQRASTKAVPELQVGKNSSQRPASSKLSSQSHASKILSRQQPAAKVAPVSQVGKTPLQQQSSRKVSPGSQLSKTPSRTQASIKASSNPQATEISPPPQRAKPKYRPHVARKKEPQRPQPQARKPSPRKGKRPSAVVFANSSSESDSDNDDDDDDDETDWAVECLEDMELYDVEGRGLVRYFKVRWEGDWPPDQKSTWEPEENIPDHLVREFCLTFSKTKRKSSTVSSSSAAGPAAAPVRGNNDGARSIDQGELLLPPLRPSNRDRAAADADAGADTRPSSADSGMEKHTWDAPNSQGLRPNLNGVFPATMR
ncbi:hypothetical protein V2A60_010405 [Cordyceps javanica]